MKKVLFIALFSGLILSCSSSDSSSSTSVAGTWKLTSFTTVGAVDANNDGNATTNFMNETGCYNNSTIVLNSNNTAIGTLNELELNLDLVAGSTTQYEYTSICNDGIPSTGTWTQSGNNVSITLDGETEVLTKSGNTITLTIPEFTEVPTESNGVISYTYYGATLVFTKQ
jgi:hypothetical protein